MSLLRIKPIYIFQIKIRISEDYKIIRMFKSYFQNSETKVLFKQKLRKRGLIYQPMISLFNLFLLKNILAPISYGFEKLWD